MQCKYDGRELTLKSWEQKLPVDPARTAVKNSCQPGTYEYYECPLCCMTYSPEEVKEK